MFQCPPGAAAALFRPILSGNQTRPLVDRGSVWGVVLGWICSKPLLNHEVANLFFAGGNQTVSHADLSRYPRHVRIPGIGIWLRFSGPCSRNPALREREREGGDGDDDGGVPNKRRNSAWPSHGTFLKQVEFKILSLSVTPSPEHLEKRAECETSHHQG